MTETEKLPDEADAKEVERLQRLVDVKLRFVASVYGVKVRIVRREGSRERRLVMDIWAGSDIRLSDSVDVTGLDFDGIETEFLGWLFTQRPGYAESFAMKKIKAKIAGGAL